MKLKIIKLTPEGKSIEQELIKQVREEISRADSKSSIILAGLTFALGAVISSLFMGRWNPSSLEIHAQIAWWIGVGSILLSLFSLAQTIYPRTKNTNVNRVENLVAYYGDIHQLSSAALVSNLNNTAVQESSQTDQLLMLSKIAYKKYSHLKRGLNLAGFALVFFAITYILQLVI